MVVVGVWGRVDRSDRGVGFQSHCRSMGDRVVRMVRVWVRVVGVGCGDRGVVVREGSVSVVGGR